MPLGVFDQIKQQTFLGASILNFSANLGINGSPSSLSVNLIEDTRNNTLPNGRPRIFNGSAEGEGYHPTEIAAGDVAPANIINSKYPGKDYNILEHSKFHELPAAMGELQGYDNAGVRADAVGKFLYRFGDYFCPPPLGTPVWFNYHKYDDLGNQNPLPVELMSSTKKNTFNGLLTNYSIKQGTSGRTISVEVQDPRLILQGVQVILDGYRDLTPPPDWSTGKITKQNFNHPANGEPTRKLHHGYNGYYNIINVYGYYENYFQWRLNVDNPDHAIWARQTGAGPAQSLHGGYAAGVRGNAGLGMSDTNEGGMRWYDDTKNRKVNVAPADQPPVLKDAPGFPSIWVSLQHMLMGWPARTLATNQPGVINKPPRDYQYYDDTGNESFGGPIYYVVKERKNNLGAPMPTAVNEITEPTNVYRFKVDLSDMAKLSKPVPIPGVGGIGIARVLPPALPKYYRVKASSMNLLELIEHVCSDANADFIVELLPDLDSAGGTFEDRSLDGIIKIKVIEKRAKPDTTIIAREIRKAEWSLCGVGGPCARARQHQWYNRITSYDMGKDFATEPAGKMIVGGPETRVVGADIRLGVDRVDFTKCTCIKGENVENQVVGFPWPVANTRAVCEGLGDEYAWRCFRRPTDFDGVQLPGAYRLDNDGTWGLIERTTTGNNNVYSPGDWRVIMDPDRYGGFFNDQNADYDASDRLHVQNTTNLTPIDTSVNMLSGAGVGGREVWSVWGKLRHSPLGGSHDGLDLQYVPTDVDDEYDYCNAETGQCRFSIGYFGCVDKDNGQVIRCGTGGAQVPQVEEYYNTISGDKTGEPLFNQAFRQDYRIDIFPCWGFFNTYENEIINGVVGKEDIVITDKAVPIKGDFDEMNPYRDFHPYMGVGQIFMYVLKFPVYTRDATDERNIVGIPPTVKLGETEHTFPDGVKRYDSVSFCTEKLMEEAKAAGELFDIKKDAVKYKDAYITPCDPRTGSRVFGYTRYNEPGNGPEVKGPRVMPEKGLDSMLEAGDITEQQYIDIVKGAMLKPFTAPNTGADDAVVTEIQAVHVNIKDANGQYLSPPSATIPIDLREAGVQDLTLGTGRRAHGGIHLATVMELRHALISKMAWEDYVRRFDPQFATDIGMRSKKSGGNWIGAHLNHPTTASANGTDPTIAPMGHPGKSSILGMDTSFGVLRSTAVSPDESELEKSITKVYEIVKGIADNFYGKQFLMPLPYDPQRLSEYEKRTYVDEEQKIPAYKVTNKWEIAQAGWVDTETKAAMAITAGGETAGALIEEQRYIKYPKNGMFFNADGMLETYMVFPHKVWVDVKKTTETVSTTPQMPGPDTVQEGLSGDKAKVLTPIACPPCDDDSWKKNGQDDILGHQSGSLVEGQPNYHPIDIFSSEAECRKYFQNAKGKFTKPVTTRITDSCLDQSGRDICNEIDPDVKLKFRDDGTTPNQQTSPCNWGFKREVKDEIELQFVPLDFSEFDRNDYYIENQRDDGPIGEYCTNALYDSKETCQDEGISGGTLKKCDKRCTPDGLLLDINPSHWINSSNGNAYLSRVFVKAQVDDKTYWLDSDIYNSRRIVSPDQRAALGSAGICSDSTHTDKDACEGADETWTTCEGGGCDQKRPYALVQLSSVVRYPKDSIIGASAANYGGAHIRLHLVKDMMFFGGTNFFTKMGPAAFKPWEAAVPQQSSVSSWGPWSNGEFYGAAKFEDDSALTPQEYGSLHGMNLAGGAKAGFEAMEHQEQESGSVSITGLPESPLGGRLFSGGPYITNITVDIGTGGITTGYKMETYKRQLGRDTMYEVDRANRVRKAQFAREKESRDNQKYRNRPKKDD